MKITKKLANGIVAGIFGIVGVSTVITSFATSQSVWYTSFESSDKNPTYSDTIDWNANIGSYNPGGKVEASVRQEVARSGSKALMYSGNDMSSSGSFVYMKSFDVDIPITNDTSFSYYMYPQSYNGTCVSVDLQFSDGSTLRDSPAKDLNGKSLHPNQCHGKNMPLNQWTKIEAKLGEYMAGRTVKRIWIAYDQPENTGQFRGYIDDLSFFRTTPVIPSTVTDTYLAKYWNYSGNPAIPSRSPDATNQTSTLSFNWGGGKPNDRINSDQFVAQWQKKQDFQAGQYIFTASADDGIRVFLDDQQVINQWVNQSYTTTTVTKAVTAGQHTVRVEYYENSGDARVDFSIAKTREQQSTTPVVTMPTPTNPTPTPTPTPTPAPTTVPVTTAPTSGYPLYGIKLFNDTANDLAAVQAKNIESSNPTNAALLRKISSQPRGTWMGSWSGDIKSATNDIVTRGAAQKAVPMLIAYNIPFRDCGQYSAGGLSGATEYNQWISNMAAGINGRKTIVILEPDALGLLNCLSDNDKNQRYAMLSNAVTVLQKSGALVYIEASHWVNTSDMAASLQKSNIAGATGFSINVSGFNKTDDMVRFGNELSGKVGGKHFVIDTSRNGNGTNGEWCNPSGRALGNPPQTFNNGNVDAYLWLKKPGESDGTCNGGPAAGEWWGEYAIGLASRSPF